MEVKKAVIPAAGLGTRFLPATKTMPKEMLPLIDYPVIQYVVEEAISSGIDDILIITGRGKRAIEDYFDDSPELEHYLKKKKNKRLLKVVQEVSSLADIHYIRQKEPKGLGDAVLRAEKHIGDEPFALLLGDDVIRHSIPCTLQLMGIFSQYNAPVIAVEKIPREKISSYGIIQGQQVADSVYILEDIVEKPSFEQAPSDIGAIGRYIFSSEIFDYLRQTPVGIGGEIQLTDAIRLFLEKQKVYAYAFKGKRYDTGDRVGYIKAIIDFALEEPALRNNIMVHMKEALLQGKQGSLEKAE